MSLGAAKRGQRVQRAARRPPGRRRGEPVSVGRPRTRTPGRPSGRKLTGGQSPPSPKRSARARAFGGSPKRTRSRDWRRPGVGAARSIPPQSGGQRRGRRPLPARGARGDGAKPKARSRVAAEASTGRQRRRPAASGLGIGASSPDAAGARPVTIRARSPHIILTPLCSHRANIGASRFANKAPSSLYP